MSLYSLCHLPISYFICILNSTFAYQYLKNFINASVNLQINDFRQIPIIIPTEKQLLNFESLFYQTYKIQKDKFAHNLNQIEVRFKLEILQKKLDSAIYELYGLI